MYVMLFILLLVWLYNRLYDVACQWTWRAFYGAVVRGEIWFTWRWLAIRVVWHSLVSIYSLIIRDIMLTMTRNSIVDPRQALTISFYRNPDSQTFGNLYQSLVKAGYEPKYARTIYSKDPDWLTETVKRDVNMIAKAERNLEKYINLEIDLKSKIGVDIAKLQADVSKFVLKTLARQKYSEDKEDVTPSVTINITNYNEAETKEVDPQVREAEVVDPQG